MLFLPVSTCHKLTYAEKASKNKQALFIGSGGYSDECFYCTAVQYIHFPQKGKRSEGSKNERS